MSFCECKNADNQHILTMPRKPQRLKQPTTVPAIADLVLDPTEPNQNPPAVEPGSEEVFLAPRMFRGQELAPFGRTEQVLWLNFVNSDDSLSFYMLGLVYILHFFGETEEGYRRVIADEEQRWHEVYRQWHKTNPNRLDTRANLTEWIAEFEEGEVKKGTELASDILEAYRKSQLKPGDKSGESEGGEAPKK